MSFNPIKTDIMVFSNTDVGYNFIFSINGNNIPINGSTLTIGGLQQRLHKQLMMLPCLSLFAFFDANNYQTI
jgi:hypothetical protein